MARCRVAVRKLAAALERSDSPHVLMLRVGEGSGVSPDLLGRRGRGSSPTDWCRAIRVGSDACGPTAAPRPLRG